MRSGRSSWWWHGVDYAVPTMTYSKAAWGRQHCCLWSVDDRPACCTSSTLADSRCEASRACKRRPGFKPYAFAFPATTCQSFFGCPYLFLKCAKIATSTVFPLMNWSSNCGSGPAQLQHSQCTHQFHAVLQQRGQHFPHNHLCGAAIFTQSSHFITGLSLDHLVGNCYPQVNHSTWMEVQ